MGQEYRPEPGGNNAERPVRFLPIHIGQLMKVLRAPDGRGLHPHPQGPQAADLPQNERMGKSVIPKLQSTNVILYAVKK